MKMRVLGLTGPSGAGKGEAGRILASLGASVIDCDAVYHGMLASDAALRADLTAAFPDCADGSGGVDRRKLAGVVFADKAKLETLNTLAFRHIRRVLREKLAGLEADGCAVAVLDAPTLFEAGADALCGATLAVLAPEAVRLARLRQRDGLSEEALRARMASQHDETFFREACTFCVVNDGDLEALRRQVGTVYNRIKGETDMKQDTKKLKEKLFYAPKNGYDRISDEQRAAIREMGEAYKEFLNNARTERAAARYAVQLAEAAGFVPYTEGMRLSAGDRVYVVNRAKSVLLAVIGRRDLSEGIRVAAAHVDCPRLDLKPMPLSQETGELCTLRTHYYGGIKKYQWTTIPLALIGVVAMKDGSVIDIEIGTKPGDPVFTVTDLLPHLGKDQMAKTAADAVTGENLRVLCGSEPVGDPKESDRVKLGVLALLNEQYGITEADFQSAELSVVPAFDARDVGLDRSLVGGYGQDDRSCAFAELEAIFSLKVPEKTAVCILADKEEIGSVGSTGMQSEYFDMFVDSLCRAQGVPLLQCLGHSECLSADVSAAYDPLYAEAYEKQNSSFANYGMAVAKYTGARGKSGCNDAHAEFLGRLRAAFDEADVVYHVCELGKVDQGGGGTVAAYMGNRNIETVDVGVPVLSMHAPFEVVSKLDVYMTAQAIRAFYRMDAEEE